MNMFKKTVSLFLALTLLLSIFVIPATAQESPSDDTYYYGAFYYRPGTGEFDPGTEFVDYYAFSDDYFRRSGKVYNDHLSTASFALAAASVSSTREPFTEEGYRNKSRNVAAFLEDIGFSQIKLNADYYIKPTKDTVGIACARKQIVDGNNEYTLLAVLPRSAGYEAEWGDNFVLGADGDAQGFDNNANKCLAFAKDYIAEQGIEGDIKVWTTGYSRGASIANLMARKLIDAPKEYLGDSIELEPENLYAYTCGTPSAADVDNDPRGKKYSGIFNSYLETEFASAMAPVDMGFTRYGTDRILYKADRYEDMLRNLSIENDYIYTNYRDSINSNQYVPKKLSIADGSIGLVEDPDSYLPTDPAVYLRGLCTYLTQISGGRKNYAARYEQPFSDLIAYYESLTGEDASAFTSALTSDNDTVYLVAGLYAYFMRMKSTSGTRYSTSELRGKSEEIAALAAAADGAQTGIDASVVPKVMGKLGSYLLMRPNDIKAEAGRYLRILLVKAMKASHASAAMIKKLDGTKQCEALVHLISHLLLGNIWQSDEVRPLNLGNEQIKAAATLIGNAANLFVDHANEIIIAWLKTEDSYYDDYKAMTDAQLNAYRRVYIDSESTVNGAVIDENGMVLAEIKDNVLTNVKDHWIGFTTCDEGDFFRLPAGKSYQIQMTVSKDDPIDIGIGEYDVYSATVTECLSKSFDAAATDKITVSLPAMEEYDVPSDAEYEIAVTARADTLLLGDADLDGTVDVTDVTCIQRYDAQMIKLTPDAMVTADVDRDSEVSVTDATFISRWLVDQPAVEGIGEPIKAE